jgi:hypothetical protein
MPLAQACYLSSKMLACAAYHGEYLEQDYPDYPRDGMKSGSPMLGALEMASK